MKIFEYIFDLFFPPKCISCEKMGTYVCPACRRKITYLTEGINPPPDLDALFAVSDYQGPVIGKAIKAFKYEKLSAIAPTLADLMGKKIKKEKIKFDVITFIPSSRKRQSWRGFNQSELLAVELGKIFQKPIFNGITKTKETKTQVGLGKRERVKNLSGTITCTSKKGVLRKKVLVVDDVVTTGATLSECAKVLKKAGASAVFALVIAKE